MRLLGHVPKAAWACALIATANALAWAILVPPFYVPDENAHIAYVQYLAETGEPPKRTPPKNAPKPPYSPEEVRTLAALRFYGVIGQPGNRPPWSQAERRGLERLQADHPSRVGPGNAETAASNPPLFYLLEAVPYKLGGSANLLDRLVLMRVLSGLMAGLTVVCVFMFVRELLPATPWAWTVGALATAFQPMFGFIAGGVNNDNLLYLCSAALFVALARAFRRGLTTRRGAAIGAALGAGLVAKLTMIAFIPGVALALSYLLWRDRRGGRRQTLRGAGLTAGVAALPVLVYALFSRAVWHTPVWGPGYAVSGTGPGRPGSLNELLSYSWQLYLPRLSFMTDVFPTNFPLWDSWFRGFFGRFGWLDYDFPPRVYDVALVVSLVLVLLATVELVRSRAILRTRLPELASYLSLGAGLLAVIATGGYQASLAGYTFAQARYLLPLLPLYAALVALAARGGGRRWGPALGALVVILAVALSIFGQLATINRFYV